MLGEAGPEIGGPLLGQGREAEGKDPVLAPGRRPPLDQEVVAELLLRPLVEGEYGLLDLLGRKAAEPRSLESLGDAGKLEGLALPPPLEDGEGGAEGVGQDDGALAPTAPDRVRGESQCTVVEAPMGSTSPGPLGS